MFKAGYPLDGGDTLAGAATRIADNNSKNAEAISRYANDNHYVPKINVGYAKNETCEINSIFPCTDLDMVDSMYIVNLV